MLIVKGYGFHKLAISSVIKLIKLNTKNVYLKLIAYQLLRMEYHKILKNFFIDFI